MLNEKMNKCEHRCCDALSGERSICKECGNKGKPVTEITVKNLVKKPKFESIKVLDGLYFCETPSCKVVYFNNEQGVYLHKEDVTVRVGIKETDGSIPVCYCFGWTRKRISNQLQQQGFSTAAEEISARIKARECNCAVNNPSGRCCIGEVNKLVKQLQSRAGST